MGAIQYTIATTDEDLHGILQLQQENLPAHISREEALTEGFVTVEHHFSLLREMNSPWPHVVAKDGDAVIGYTLVMLQSLRSRIPVLVPMFEQIDGIVYRGRILRDTPYVVMGQVCIAKGYRGQGVFAGLYAEMARRLSSHFRYIVTEISKRNPRSIRAHEKAGFAAIHEYKSPDGEEWVIVLLEI